VRLLADVRPPYGVREIAAATGLTPGYVSRLLETLDHEALVDRAARGRVVAVDVDGLLRRWAESYDVLSANEAATYVAPSGARDALGRLPASDAARGVVVTGSFAAVRLAPVAAPALLAAYCDEPERVAEALALLPADEGGDVVLLRPFDVVAKERAVAGEDGITYAAPSQVAVDCLTGTGRMPAEGEAVLGWLRADEARWRRASLAARS